MATGRPGGRTPSPVRALLGAVSLVLLAGCAGPAAALPAHGASCTGPAGVTVGYPAGWVTNGAGTVPACSLFSAVPFPVVPGSDVRTAPLAVRVVDLTFGTATVVLPEETGRVEGTVDGLPAVRIQAAAGPGLWPEGTPSVRWVVDLGGRVLVADAVGLAGSDHERDVAVLDAMAAGLDLRAALRPAPDLHDHLVGGAEDLRD